MWSFKKVKLGKLKNLDDITLDDMLKNPIWVNDLSGENLTDFDETSECPLINAKNVTTQMLEEYVSVCILVKVIDSEKYGSGYYEENGNLSGMSFWVNEAWKSAQESFSEEKVIIESIPSINEIKNCQFTLNVKKDVATRANV